MMNWFSTFIPANDLKWKEDFARKIDTFIKFAKSHPKEPLQLFKSQTSSYKTIIKSYSPQNVKLFQKHWRKIDLLKLVNIEPFMKLFLTPAYKDKLPIFWTKLGKLNQLVKSAESLNPVVMDFLGNILTKVGEMRNRTGSAPPLNELLDYTIGEATKDSTLISSIIKTKITNGSAGKHYKLDPETENLTDEIQKLESESGYENVPVD